MASNNTASIAQARKLVEQLKMEANIDRIKSGRDVVFDSSLPVIHTDATLNEAAAILRLLHIEELRDLQTRINEAIVAVQAIIADPKTDHRLGKVGR
ncbi:UNVERIFIED_CONTAM: hypothetical protein FKN15_045400 [Acipenser sinensis]